MKSVSVTYCVLSRSFHEECWFFFWFWFWFWFFGIHVTVVSSFPCNWSAFRLVAFVYVIFYFPHWFPFLVHTPYISVFLWLPRNGHTINYILRGAAPFSFHLFFVSLLSQEAFSFFLSFNDGYGSG